VKRKVLLSLSAFVAALGLHAWYFVIRGETLAARWAMTTETSYFRVYIERSEYLIGASYALAIGFSVYALLRFLETRKRGVAGLVGGITLTGVLYVAGCFLLGCCGSPMLAVYMTLFGSSFLGFAKPLTFALTVASIVIGYIWMERKPVSAADCCEAEEECKPT